jgi:predicted nucleic acid-binding protein
MPRQTATIDTSCFIALNHLQLLEKLSIIFDTVYVPRAVRKELSRRGGPRRQLLSVLRRIALYKRCDVGDHTRVDLLLIEHRRPASPPKKDLGEAEAVIQATEIPASMVIMDDPLGRSWADGHSLDKHGLIWILRQLRQFGAILELKPYFRALESIEYRLPPDKVRDLLVEFAEEA